MTNDIARLLEVAQSLRSVAGTMRLDALELETIADSLAANSPEPGPEPDPEPQPPEPEPEPEPTPKGTQIGWNLGPQNYYEPVQYCTDWLCGQIYDVDPRASLDETGMPLLDDPHGKIEVFRIEAVMRKGEYKFENGDTAFVVLDERLNARSVHVDGPVSIFHHSQSDYPRIGSPTDTFLTRHEYSSHIRLMDVNLTNSRDPLGDDLAFWRYRQTPRGTRRVFRMMTPVLAHQLAQASNSDLWWNFHHLDSDARIASICRRFAELGDDYRITFEHSNEVWYGLFPANKWLRDQRDNNQREMFRLHGKLTNKIGRIAKDILGDRAFIVAGSQTANLGVTNYILEGIASDADDYVDAIAVNGYFGDLANYGGAMTQSGITQWVTQFELQKTREWLLRQNDIADRAGKTLAVYEGGVHLRPDEAYNDVLYAVLESDEAARVMDDHLTWFERDIGGPYTVYCDVGKKTWGHWDTEWSDPQPRGQVVLDHMQRVRT